MYKFMFSGTFVALVTPFHDRSDRDIDYESLEKLLDFQMKHNINGLVVCASTGEGTLLTSEEHEDIIKFVVKTVNGKIPVLAGCSSCSTPEAIHHMIVAEDSGASGILLNAPYYIKPNQEGILYHFKMVCCKSSIPVVVYNIPSRVSVNLNLDTLREIFQFPNVVALKDATKNFETLSTLHNEFPNISILSGDDGTLPACLAHGACGTISAAANVFPKEISDIVNSWNNNDLQQFKNVSKALVYINKVMSVTTNPLPIKYILSKMNMIHNVVREPMWFLRENEQLDNLIKNLTKH